MNSSQSSFTDLHDWSSLYQNLQTIQLDILSSKLNLHFETLPDFQAFLKLYESQKIENCLFWNEQEELLLQLIVLSQNPKCLKNHYDWEKVQKLMPKHRSLADLCFKFQSFFKTQIPRQPWSDFEDQALLNIIMENPNSNKKKWSVIADRYNTLCQSKIIRNPKQCRERWNNKLDPQINRDNWSKLEELHFLTLLLQNGRKWADVSIKLSIHTKFKRRTEFALKHKFKQLQKYSGTKPKTLHRCDFDISHKWNNQEVDMILSKIENLQRKCYESNTKEYSFCQFQSLDSTFSLIVMKNGYICHIL